MLEDAYLSLGTLYEEERNYHGRPNAPGIATQRATLSFMGYFQLARMMIELKDYLQPKRCCRRRFR